MNRRDLLKALAALPALPLSARLYAADTARHYPRFLLVFLRGGYDCANVLVPVSSSYYYESRPTIVFDDPRVTSQACTAWMLALGFAVFWRLHWSPNRESFGTAVTPRW